MADVDASPVSARERLEQLRKGSARDALNRLRVTQLGTLPVLSEAESAQATPTGPRAIPVPFTGVSASPTGQVSAQGGTAGRELSIQATPPPWLQTVESWLPLVGGIGGAALTAPVAAVYTGATAGGGTAPATALEALGFAGGEQAGVEASRALNRALGYQVPPRTMGERATEVVGSSLAYPVGGVVAEQAPLAIKGMLGITAQRKAEQDAIAKTTKVLDDLGQLHSRVESIADTAGAGAVRGLEKARTELREAAGRRTARAPQGMIGRLGAETEQGAYQRATSLREGAKYREETIAPMERLYGLVQGGLGQEYDDLLQPHLKEAAPTGTLGSLSEQATALKENSKQYALDSKANALINRVIGWGQKSEGPEKIFIGGVEIPLGTAKPSTGGAIPAKQPEAVKWEELKQVRDALRPLLKSRSLPTRNAMRQLDGIITDAYSEGGLPIDPELNARYRNWRARWRTPQLNTLHDAYRPEQLKSIVNENTIGPLLKSGDPEAREIAAQTAASIIRKENLSPKQIVDRFSPNVLRDIFGKGADDVVTWANVNANTAQINDILQAAPQLRTRFEYDVNAEARRAFAKGARETKKSVMAMLKKLGPPADNIRSRVAKMSDEAATQFYIDQMRSPRFGQDLIAAAKSGARVPVLQRMSFGSLPFALGLGVMELWRRGEVTSPYVASVPFALGLEATAMIAPQAITRLIERDGFQTVVRLLKQATSPITQRVAMKDLAKRFGQVLAGDTFRAAMQPTEAEPGSTDAMQELMQQGGQ